MHLTNRNQMDISIRVAYNPRTYDGTSFRCGVRAVWLAALLLGLSVAAQSATHSQMQECPISSGGRPAGITAGPDGALWFTEGSGQIGRITTAGVFSEYPVPTPNSQPWAITIGPDSALWFTDLSGQIGRITIAGVITEFPVPTPGSQPLGIATGPDGALWFTESLTSKIGRVTTAGDFTEYSVGVAEENFPQYITAGPDGALWFTYTGIFASGVGRITTAGALAEYQTPTAPRSLSEK